ncbi:MAG: hypothetical protein ACMUHU_03795 [Thermoplasmatota archaeon]
MGRVVFLMVGILMISSFGAILFVDAVEALEDGISYMEMYAKDDMYLTPEKVNETTMEFNRSDDRWPNLPMVPWQWYRLGEWDSGSIDSDYVNADPIVIRGISTIWITLSCPETITMDLSGSFCVASNPAVDPIILEDVEVGPEPVTFTLEFDTDGYTNERFRHFSMRWSMRNGHDDVVIHLGEEYAGVSTYIEPLFVQETMDSGKNGLFVEFINKFEEFDWDEDWLNETGWEFDFRASVDDGPWEEVEDFYSMHGATDYHYLTVPGFEGTPGEHVLRWEADYGANSHSSGVYWFTVEENPPPDDDDEPPVDDDEEPPVGDDDEEPIELLTAQQCERTYVDEQGDDLGYWADDNNDAGVEKGVMPGVDIKQVTSRRDGDDLVITVTTFDTIDEWTSVIIYILPDDTYHQAPLDLDPQTGDDIPDSKPGDHIDTNLFNFWIEEKRLGNSFTATWSLESLMEDGLTPDFEIFVQVLHFDAAISGPITDPDHVIAYYNVDYAGSGAWVVGNLEERSGDPDIDTGISPLAFMIPVVVILVAIALLVILVAYVIIREKRKRLFD